MALGDETDTVNGRSYVVELLASATAANGLPSGGSAGIATSQLSRFGKTPDKIRVGVNSTAGSSPMTVALRVWLYAGGIWFRAKDLNATDATPSTASPIAETSDASVKYSEEVTGLACAARIYLEIVSINGTSHAVTGYAIVG